MPGQTLGSQELADLAVYLRQQNFSVGTAQVESAQRLLWRMAEQGISKPASELRPWLGPIFATNARDLERFDDLYTRWKPSLVIAPSPPPPRGRAILLWSIGTLLVAAVAAGLWIYKRPKNTQVSPPPVSNAPLRKDGSREPSNDIATAAGSFQSGDGKPIAHVRLLFSGHDSEASNQGTFSITGKALEPVLATHCDYDAVLFPLLDRSDYNLRMVRKSQSACTPGLGPSAPNDPRPRYQRIRLAVSAIPMLAFLAWTIYVFWKRVGLRKWGRAATSRFAQIPLGDSADRLFPETELQRSVQELRRPRPIPFREIWPEPTVTATVENAGWFTPVYRARRRIAEYLVLIDRTGKRDQQAHFADELLGRLKARGVYVQVCYFNSDPRTCTDSETGQSIAITDLSARFGQCQVWVVADGSTFFNGFTGRPERWVDLFQQWPSRVLLTPASPNNWGDHEIRLADLGFEIIPASPRGLARITEHLATPDVALDSYPPLLEERPTRWTSGQAPTTREATRLCTELRLYLGRDGFRWLAACAEYPAIEWPLTLYLGNTLMRPETLEPVLRKLVRLPWFRRGSMPQWLRVALRKDKQLRRRILQLFADRLNSMPISPVPVEGDGVEVAIERDYQRRVEEDEIWLSLLWGREPGSLTLPASGLRRLLFHRRRVWLGPRFVVLFAAAVLSSAGIWWGMRFRAPSFNPPQPQIERSALDVAMSQYHNASYYRANYSSDRSVQFPEWCYWITQLVLRRSIALAPPAKGSELTPGDISSLNSDEGLYAGAGWSLSFQGDHIVAQKNHSLYKRAVLSSGTLPLGLPASPDMGLTGETQPPPPLPSWSRPQISVIVPEGVSAPVAKLIAALRSRGYTVKATVQPHNQQPDAGSIDYYAPKVSAEDQVAAEEITLLAQGYGWSGPRATTFKTKNVRHEVQVWYPRDYDDGSFKTARYVVSGSFENGYAYNPESTVTLDLETGRVVSAYVVIEQTGEVFASKPVYDTESVWQWQNQGSLSGSLDFQDKSRTFAGYPGGLLTHAAYWTPALGRNVLSTNTILDNVGVGEPKRHEPQLTSQVPQKEVVKPAVVSQPLEGLYRSDQEVGTAGLTWPYLRFFRDGTVLAVSSTGTPDQVGRWLQESYPNAASGVYNVDNSTLKFSTTSGGGTTDYTGTIAGNTLSLDIRNNANDFRDHKVYRLVASEQPASPATKTGGEPTTTNQRAVFGVVRTGDDKSVAGIQVSVPGVGSSLTTATGQFWIPLPSTFGPGSSIQFEVQGGKIVSPWNGRANLPQDSSEPIVIVVSGPDKTPNLAGARVDQGVASTGTSIFDNWNTGAVENNPVNPTTFTIKEPYFITRIANYHWNNGRGASPDKAMIALHRSDGEPIGYWPVLASAGQGGARNVDWESTPNVTIPAGAYVIADSDPGTWSHNQQSGNAGFSRVQGYPAAGENVDQPGASQVPNQTPVAPPRREINPQAPVGTSSAAVVAAVGGGYDVNLSWEPSPSTKNVQVVGYSIYRGTAPKGPYTKIATLVTGSSYTDHDVILGRTYFYVTTAVSNQGVESAYSNEVKAVIPFK